MSIGTFFAGLFNSLVRVFKAFIAEAIPIAEQIIIAQLKNTAYFAVNALVNSDLTNEQKRSKAFEQIKSYSIGKGIDAKDSIINLVVELTLQKIKNGVK